MHTFDLTVSCASELCQHLGRRVDVGRPEVDGLTKGWCGGVVVRWVAVVNGYRTSPQPTQPQPSPYTTSPTLHHISYPTTHLPPYNTSTTLHHISHPTPHLPPYTTSPTLHHISHPTPHLPSYTPSYLDHLVNGAAPWLSWPYWHCASREHISQSDLGVTWNRHGMRWDAVGCCLIR